MPKIADFKQIAFFIPSFKKDENPNDCFMCKQRDICLLYKRTNVTSDAGAGASNPHPHPNPPQTLKHTQKVSKMLISPLFNSMTASNGRTNEPTDGRKKPLIELRVRN